jgi:hypothetical protein
VVRTKIVNLHSTRSSMLLEFNGRRKRKERKALNTALKFGEFCSKLSHSVRDLLYDAKEWGTVIGGLSKRSGLVSDTVGRAIYNSLVLSTSIAIRVIFSS